jgi:outer membrane protein assembly factor BamB
MTNKCCWVKHCYMNLLSSIRNLQYETETSRSIIELLPKPECGAAMQAMQRIVRESINRVYVLLSFIVFGANPFCTQAQNTFFRTFGIDTLHEEGASVVQTPDGGFLVAGSEVVPAPLQLYKGNGVLLRTNELGEEIWRHAFSPLGTHGLEFRHLVALANGQYAITGVYSYEWNASPTDDDVFLAVYNASGDELWNVKVGGAFRDVGNQVRQLQDGGYAVGGTRWHTNLGEGAACIARFNEQGDSLWMRTYPNPLGGAQTAKCIRATLDFGFYLGGGREHPIGTKAYVLRTNQLGDTLWSRTLDTLEAGEVRDMLVCPDNGVVFTGYSTATGFSRPFLAKLDAAGELFFSRNYPEVEPGWANSICQTATGYALFGMSADYQFRTLSVDFDGDLLWAHTLETESGYQYGEDIATTADGGFVMTGATTAGMIDMVLIKTDSNGQINTGIESAPPSSLGLNVFPNPTTGLATVSCTPKHAGPVRARLLDIGGQEVRTFQTHGHGSGQFAIDLEGLPFATYLIEVKAQGESWMLRVAKQ